MPSAERLDKQDVPRIVEGATHYAKQSRVMLSSAAEGYCQEAETRACDFRVDRRECRPCACRFPVEGDRTVQVSAVFRLSSGVVR